MIVAALLLRLSGADQPALSFDHQSFCQKMQQAAEQEDVRAGKVIDRWTTHGGIFVDCDHRSVDMRTLLSRPVTKRWLNAEQRYWTDDICADPEIADATANSWKMTASISVNGKLVAVFQAHCSVAR